MSAKAKGAPHGPAITVQYHGGWGEGKYHGSVETVADSRGVEHHRSVCGQSLMDPVRINGAPTSFDAAPHGVSFVCARCTKILGLSR